MGYQTVLITVCMFSRLGEGFLCHKAGDLTGAKKLLENKFPTWGIASREIEAPTSPGKSLKPQQKQCKFLGIITVPVAPNYQAWLNELMVSSNINSLNLLKLPDSFGLRSPLVLLTVCSTRFWKHKLTPHEIVTGSTKSIGT